MRCALKGHQNPARHIEIISSASAPSFSRHFQGAFLDRGYPGLKPWAEIFSPFRGEIRFHHQLTLYQIAELDFQAEKLLRHFQYHLD
jgi:hypothetical protein